MRLRRLALVLVPLALAVVASACGGETGGGDGSAAATLPTEPDALPEFTLADYETLIGGLRGTPVVVNIWASWCGPCNEEAPTLAAAHATYGDRVQFLGVDILDSREGAREFIATYDWRYPSVFDPDGAIRDGLGLLGQPVTLFYSADGLLISSYTGAIPEAEFEARIAEILPASV